MGGARGTWTTEEKCVQNKLVRETRKRPLTTPPRNWENNIKKDLKEKEKKVERITAFEDVWAVVSTAMNLRVP